jgi:hypothetical protein
VRGDDRVSAAERLEIYANAYFYRILDCLKQDLPALEVCLGGDGFHDLVTAYLVSHPPRHPSLRHAGDRLALFLAGGAAEPFVRRCPWAHDLARLEWALVDAFDAPDAPSLSRETLARVAPDDWSSLGFVFHPSLEVLDLDWPVSRVRDCWDRDGQVPTRLDPAPGSVCVWRRDERVFQRPLPRLEAEALDLARRGASFAELCDQISRQVGDDAAPEHAAALLSGWQGDGWLSGLTQLDQP